MGCVIVSFDPVAYALGKAGITRNVLSALMAGDGGGGGIHTIPAQTIDNFDYPGAVFSFYTGTIKFAYYGTTHTFDNTPLMVRNSGSAYGVIWASSEQFDNARTYTYNGKTVYWSSDGGRGNSTFDPEIPTELKDVNSASAYNQYGAWLMIYGGY